MYMLGCLLFLLDFLSSFTSSHIKWKSRASLGVCHSVYIARVSLLTHMDMSGVVSYERLRKDITHKTKTEKYIWPLDWPLRKKIKQFCDEWSLKYENTAKCTCTVGRTSGTMFLEGEFPSTSDFLLDSLRPSLQPFISWFIFLSWRTDGDKSLSRMGKGRGKVMEREKGKSNWGGKWDPKVKEEDCAIVKIQLASLPSSDWRMLWWTVRIVNSRTWPK